MHGDKSDNNAVFHTLLDGLEKIKNFELFGEGTNKYKVKVSLWLPTLTYSFTNLFFCSFVSLQKSLWIYCCSLSMITSVVLFAQSHPGASPRIIVTYLVCLMVFSLILVRTSILFQNRHKSIFA